MVYTFSKNGQLELEDTVTMTNAIKSIRQENASYVMVSNKKNTAESEKIIRHTTSAIRRYATSQFKSVIGLEPLEIDQIKSALRNFSCLNQYAQKIKNEIIEDLTDFQVYIKENHNKNIKENLRQKELCEREIKVLKYKKNKLVFERLAKIVWPYDAKTKEFDNKVIALGIKAKQYEQKILMGKQNRPVANEKEILLYEMKLKEKFLK